LDSYASFRSRDFRFFLAGSFAGNFGLQMLSVAVSWDLYEQTRSAVVLGNVGFVQVAPYLLFALAAGHIADRHDRRGIMVLTQAVTAAATAILCSPYRPVWLIYTVLFLMSGSRSFQAPARLAILPHIVPKGTLANAITWNSSAQEIANVSGPALAGVLIASVGTRSVYFIQLFCAAMTLVCFARIRVPNNGAEAPEAKRGLLDGVRFVRANKLILSAISLDLFAVLFGGATALLPIFAVDILHSGARGLGWLRAAPSIGAVSMALLQSHRPRAKHAGRLLLAAVAGFGAATVIFGISHWFWLSWAMLLATGVFDNISVVLRQSLVQTRTPDAIKGRVLAVQNIFISCSNQLGAVESGWTAAWFGPVLSVAGGGLATLAIVAGFAAGAAALRRWTQ
jgi:predicted MFS family arabinose efflux permease